MSYEDECNEYYFGIPFKKRVSAAEVEPKFKVGDRVICNGNFSFDPSVGTVSKDGGHFYGVRLDAAPDGYSETVWSYLDDELTLAPAFTPGDRVKLKRHFGPHGVGDEGKVRELITKAGFVNAGVEMDPWGVYTVLPVEVLELAADCPQDNILAKALAPKPKFKAGDVVTYSDGRYRKTIKGISAFGNGRTAYDYVGGGFDYETSLFLAAPCPQDNRQQPAIVARILDGQPRPSNTPYMHASSADALTEAERLAKNNPGQEFAVYQRVGARVCEVQYNMKEVA